MCLQLIRILFLHLFHHNCTATSSDVFLIWLIFTCASPCTWPRCKLQAESKVAGYTVCKCRWSVNILMPVCVRTRHKNGCIYNNSSNVHILLETDLRFRSSEVPKRQRWQQHKRMSLQKLFWISSWIPQEEWNWEDHLRAAPTVPMSVTQLPFSFPCPHILLPPSRHLSGEARLIQLHH